MASYLSIDIDYFNPYLSLALASCCDIEGEIRQLIERAIIRELPILAVMNHQQLLDHVNKSDAKTLINLDTHSDLCYKETGILDCGSWVSFVSWRHRGKYQWVRAQESIDDGNCNGSRRWSSDTDWKEVGAIRHISSTEKFLRNDCVGVGFCMSPSYARKPLVSLFRKIVSEYKIPYKKGRLNEHNILRRMKPPGRK